MIKPMLPTLIFDAPSGSDWLYEIKYDGFRALLHWDHDNIKLVSRNGNLLNDQFPEIINYCLSQKESFEKDLPIIFDGEVTILESPFKANFEHIQQRGRLKNTEKIAEFSRNQPAHYLVFDLILRKGVNLRGNPFIERKDRVRQLFVDNNLSSEIAHNSPQLLQLIDVNDSFQQVWEQVQFENGEGVIAKKRDGKWEEGKRTTSWYKIKNWQRGKFFITGYDRTNGFFHVSVIRNKEIYEIGLFSNGLSPEEREALLKVIQINHSEELNKGFLKVEPGICVELFYLELYKEQLRQPSFTRFCFDMKWSDCTWEDLQRKIEIPVQVTITHPDKPLWKDKNITKQDYLDYLLNISPYMLPFLKDRLLTVIRFPHGMYGESFYQKNCPDYAPDFITRSQHEGIDYIVCNNIDTLAWLGNQLAFEFHIPFQTIYSKGPSEIVFDLDPPSRNEFPLAIKAALLLKEVFEGLDLISFIKLSGNKGLQIYIPLPENTFSYDDTRVFTEFIAHYLINKEPSLFTIERLKKNRNNKLYVDYIQHAEGKTIIAPYSIRGNDGAYVAAPLFWHEIHDGLSINSFSMESIYKRVSELGDPFKDYFQSKDIQPFRPVLDFLKQR
ncbi:bifunctional non-homologous end joining protein LigD [Litchfieldia salsa]|uniref:DNA ligase (ATP) n=1 Tax=Litchfieldia salsa TaxID=930152 RepID=A0A1H0S0R9_9BACI|nr:bifunctional non-homologous end joining protein LigD [Litchfieldia salsa]